MIDQAIQAAETTDNLLTNNTFDENTSGWTLSDSNVKRDANSYSDAGNSPTIRFKGQTSTISQLVNLTGIEEGKEIKSYTISYNGYGCGNAPGGWCNDNADDTVITNITFTDGTTTEVSSNVITVPYEDGWVYHTFTKSINDLFLTGNVAVNFELTGIDTGNSSSWLGPITDNYKFLITYDDYVQQQVEEEIETMIGGLELSTEVTLDLIQDIQVMPEMEMDMTMDMPEIEMDMSGIPNETSIDMPDMIDMPPLIQEIRMEMTVDIPEIVDVEPIQEIQEIKIEVVETEINQPEMEETKDEGRKIEPETESKIETTKTTTKGSDLRESESDTGEENEGKTEESTADSDKGDESKETTTVTKTKDTSKSTSKSKPKTKAVVKDIKPTVAVKKTTRKPKATLEINTAKPKVIEQLPLPIAYLQIMQDSISIVETISLRQEQIYGGEQEYNLNTSGITVVGLDNNSSSRWSNLQDVSKRYQAPKYNNRYKEN